MVKIPALFNKIMFIGCAAACLLPFMDAPRALALGFLLSALFGNPFRQYSGKATSKLLQFSVVGLGFGMDFNEALKAGREGLAFTVCSIVLTLVVGLWLGRVLKIRKNISTLISAGTAICGGSAIAAISPVINAGEEDTSVALAAVFILNSIALFIFPVLGHALHLSAHQFGLWCAIAIHDTSSVVGAAAKFGSEALKTATTVKLERALWIIPVSLLFSVLNKDGERRKVKIPYFIFLFILAILANTYIPALQKMTPTIVFLAKKGLVLTLFLIGANLSISYLKKVGARPLVQGVALWLLISAGSLLVIKFL